MTSNSELSYCKKQKGLCKHSYHNNININININYNSGNKLKAKMLFIALLLCSNSVNSLKLTPVPNHHNNKIDLTSEARLVSNALAEATSTIKSSYSFIDVNEAEALLQQKQFRQLISAIDRWNKVGDKFHKALANDNKNSNNHQSLMLDEVSRTVVASKAMLGHLLFRSKKDSQALPLLEGSCSLLWGTIYDIETDILLDCYTALGSLYLRSDKQSLLENLQKDLITHMPWLKYALIDNAVEKSHVSDLDSVELIKLVIDLSSIERQIISSETKRAWINIDEIRLSMNTLVAEFTVADTKRKKSVLNKSKQIVDDLLERHKVASLEAIKKISDDIKNATINDIPQGLNEGNVKEHILKLSLSVIDYLKSEIEKEATYYLDIMESVIDNGKLYVNSHVRNNDVSKPSKPFENSHGFQSKADVQQIMEYIISKHENFDIKHSFAPFSSRKTSKTEQESASSSNMKYSQTSETKKDKKQTKKTSTKSSSYSYTVLITAAIGIAILALSNFFHSSTNDKQSGTRANKAKRVHKSGTSITEFKFVRNLQQNFISLSKIAHSLFEFAIGFILSKKAAMSSTDIDDELIKELTEKPRKNSGKKDKNNKDKVLKKKRNSLDASSNHNEVKILPREDEIIETIPATIDEIVLNVSSSSSDMPLYPKSAKTLDTTASNLTICTSFSPNDEWESVSMAISEDEWIVTGTQHKKKSPRSPTNQKKESSLRKEKKNSTADTKPITAKTRNNNNTIAEVKTKTSPTAVKPAVNSKVPTTTNKEKFAMSSILPAKDYRSATSSGLAVDRKSHSSPSSSSSSSSPNHATQPSISSTDNEDRSTDDSDQSIENDMNYAEPVEQPYFNDQPYFMPEMVAPSVMNNMMYRMNMSQFPQIPSPQMMTFQGPEGQIYFMPHPMQMHPFMPSPADSVSFIPSNFGQFPPNSPIRTENRDDFISRIRLQIEYYFSEENLRKDEYLKSAMDAEGYVSLAKIKTFRRIQQLGADAATMVEAVKSSTKLDVIESIRDNEDVSEITLLETKISSVAWTKTCDESNSN